MRLKYCCPLTFPSVSNEKDIYLEIFFGTTFIPDVVSEVPLGLEYRKP